MLLDAVFIQLLGKKKLKIYYSPKRMQLLPFFLTVEHFAQQKLHPRFFFCITYSRCTWMQVRVDGTYSMGIFSGAESKISGFKKKFISVFITLRVRAFKFEVMTTSESLEKLHLPLLNDKRRFVIAASQAVQFCWVNFHLSCAPKNKLL